MALPIVDRLKSELAEVQRELQHDLPARLEEARAHGDLRENAEYEAAKHRQGMLRARVAQLQTRIRELSVYTIAQIPRDRVSYGSRVTVEDVDSGDMVEYRLVFPEEVDAGSGLISISSPIGQGLMNKAEGDEVVVQTPSGRKTYQIVGVVTLHEQAGSGEARGT
ncbi:MAG TPA: transcription elongation factor GreA [Candidatus Binatia bacterium]|nr:transcription elongation factor GreA [Candidatus Binatia bacterium]